MTGVALSGMAAVSAFGRGSDALLAGVLASQAAFAPVHRFDVSGRRVGVAATLPEATTLTEELVRVVRDACDDAGLSQAQRGASLLLLAVHGYPDLGRAAPGDRPTRSAGALAAALADHCGLSTTTRAYTSACVAASTAVADAAAMVTLDQAERVVVAAGYLVEPDQYALFDAGRAMAADGRVRPFSAGRRGLLLGDGVAAVVVEPGAAVRRRGASPWAWLAGWGRSGDAYHACRPHPDGVGLARAVTAALRRGGVRPVQVGYVNAHGSGTPYSDAAEAAALRLAFGPEADPPPVSSTKSLHGQALEAAGLLELVVTAIALRRGELPVNAGYLGPDRACRLDLILDAPRRTASEYALSLNAAFGGANTALLVRAA